MKEIRNTLQGKCRRGLNDRFKNLFEEAGGKKTIRKQRIRKPKDNVSSSTSVPNGTTSNTTISNLTSVANGIVSSSTSVPNTVSSSISAGGTVAVGTTLEPMKLPNPITHIESPTTSVPNIVSSSTSASGTVAVGTTLEPMKLPNPITHIESPTEPITNIIILLKLIAEMRDVMNVKTTNLNKLFPQFKETQQEYHDLLKKLVKTSLSNIKTMINERSENEIFNSNGIFDSNNIDDILIVPSWHINFRQIRFIKHNNQIHHNIVLMYVYMIDSQIYNSTSDPPFCGLSERPRVKYSVNFIKKLLDDTKFEELVKILNIQRDKDNLITINYDTMILPYIIDSHWFICEVRVAKKPDEELYNFRITSTLNYDISTLPPNAPMKTILGTKIRNFFLKLTQSDKVRFLPILCPQMDIINLFSKLEAYTKLKLEPPTLSDILYSIIMNKWDYKNRLIKNDV